MLISTGIERLGIPMKETIFDACAVISSQPIFSRLITSGSFECAVAGSIGVPDGPKPKIWSRVSMRGRTH